MKCLVSEHHFYRLSVKRLWHLANLESPLHCANLQSLLQEDFSDLSSQDLQPIMDRGNLRPRRKADLTSVSRGKSSMI